MCTLTLECTHYIRMKTIKKQRYEDLWVKVMRSAKQCKARAHRFGQQQLSPSLYSVCYLQIRQKAKAASGQPPPLCPSHRVTRARCRSPLLRRQAPAATRQVHSLQLYPKKRRSKKTQASSEARRQQKLSLDSLWGRPGGK